MAIIPLANETFFLSVHVFHAIKLKYNTKETKLLGCLHFGEKNAPALHPRCFVEAILVLLRKVPCSFIFVQKHFETGRWRFT